MPLQDITMLVARLQNENEGMEHLKALKPYQRAARWIPVAIGPFVDIDSALYAGAAKVNNVEAPPDTGEEDIHNFRRFSKFCPELKEALRSFDGDADLLKRFIGHLSAAACSSRADDTSSCRRATADYVSAAVKTKLELNIEKKSDRGWNNPHTARLLCPLKYLAEFDEDPDRFMGGVLDGTKKIKASQWPSFLYPKGTAYNRESLEDGLFHGEILIQFLRNICTGPTSASNGIRRASKPSKAEIHHMDHVTGRCVAYVAVQAYFSLSAIEQWSSSPQEGFFNLEDFFTRCVELFETDPTDDWVVETLEFLTCELPSLKRDYKRKRKGNVQSMSSDESDEDEAKIIYAQREARRQARSIENDTSGDGTHLGSAEDGFGTIEPSVSATTNARQPPSPRTITTPSASGPSQTHSKSCAPGKPADGPSQSDSSDFSEDDEIEPPTKRSHVQRNDKKGKSRAMHA